MLLTVNDTPVFPISLGGAGIGSSKDSIFFQDVVSEKQAVETVLFALENGVNLIDTSPFYGNSEQKIGIAVKEYGMRESYVLSSKVGTHPKFKGYSDFNIRQSIDNSLKTLQTSYIDMMHIHDPSFDDFKIIMGKNGGMETLLRLKEEKLIRKIGLGVRDHDLHRKFISSGYADVILPYLDYNVLCTSADSLLKESSKNNVAVILGSALCMGLLSGKNPANTKILHYDITKDVSMEKAIRMFEWCKAKNVNLMSVNYKFILDNPAVNTIIIGASSKEEVQLSLSAYKEKIPSTIIDSFLKEFHLVN